MTFDFITYMRDCATRMKDIGHTDATPRFFRVSGIGQLDEMLSSLSQMQFPALLVHNNHDGSIGDRSTSNNYLDTPYYVFYVVEHAPLDDFDAHETVKANCKAIGLKILARMVRNKRDMLYGLTFLDFRNITYQTIGPIGDNCYGTMFSFTVSDTANLVYNASDWDE